MNKEYHLYLYFPDIALDDPSWLDYTVKEVENAISHGYRVDTMQVCTLGTYLFTEGYRIVVHDTPYSLFEITLGPCARTTREIRMGHDLEKLLLSGEFDLKDTQ